MWANVFRALGKQGTGALIVSSSRRVPFRRFLPPLLSAALASQGRPAPLSFRRFTTARVLSSDGPPPQITSFEDPSRRGLFYHLVPPPTPLSDSRPAFAVSLLAHPPPSSQSTTVLGWLPAETPGDDRDAGLNDFVENRANPFSHFFSLDVSRSGRIADLVPLVIHSALPAAPSQGDIRGACRGRR